MADIVVSGYALLRSLRNFLMVVLVFLGAMIASYAQTSGPISGEITVRLTEGLDSTTNPKGISHGVVTKSTNPAVPKNTAVVLGLGSDAINGGYTVKLLQLTISGRAIPAANSAVVLAPDFFGKALEATRAAGQPKDSVSGTRVFLPQNMIVRFTLADPPTQAYTQKTNSAAPAVPTWQLKSITDGTFPGQEATTAGIASSGSKQTLAVLAISCTVLHYVRTPPVPPSAAVKYTLRVPRGLVGFPTDQLGCEGDGAGNKYGHFQVGSEPVFVGDFCYDGSELPTSPKEPVVFGLEPSNLKAPIKSPGTEFQVKLQLPDTPGDALVARFRLPTDVSSIGAMTDPCFQVLDEEARREKAAVVVSCPNIAGETLTGVRVLMGAAMKPLPSDPENTIGISWNLPEVTKAHPVRAKATLACSYSTDTSKNPPTVVEKKMLPIPSKAAYCVVRDDDAHCSTSDGHN